MRPSQVGIIGTGAISGQYLSFLSKLPGLSVVACADLNQQSARQKAAEFSIPRVLGVDELLHDPGVDIVVNLTIPRAHASITVGALKSGKHVYSEKPLSVSREEDRRIQEAASQSGCMVACAPDTVLGSGIQNARELLDAGAIGRPVAFSALMMGRGHEHWHPSPAFYYDVGGGPMFDMGPYYLSALVNLLGPVKRLAGMAATSRPTRVITHRDSSGAPGPLFGTEIPVRTPDHVAGLLEFDEGCCGHLITSFATRAAEYEGSHPIVIYGTEGTMKVPDPNGFDGQVLVARFREGEPDRFEAVAASAKSGYGRGIGVLDLAAAIGHRREPRCGLNLALHLQEVMHAFLESSASGRFIEFAGGLRKPKPMPRSLAWGEMD
jgi:predicted dehydrogenase